MNKIKWIAVIIIVILIVVGLKVGNKSVENSKPIKIGGLFGLTGYVSFAAEDSRDGFLLAIEDYGKPVDYVIEDFRSDIKTAVSGASKLINVDKVSVIIGPEWAEFSEAVTPLASNSKVPFISPWAVTEKDWVKNPYSFTATPSERPHVKKVIGHMVSQGKKTVTLIYTNNSWSIENIEIFKDEAAKAGLQVLEEYKFAPEQKDFRTEIQQMKLKKPDAVYVPIAAGGQFGPFIKQTSELGLVTQFYLPESVGQEQSMRSQFGSYLNGVIYVMPEKYINNDKFVAKFEKKFNRKPITRTAATTYDMTTLVLKAIDAGAKTPDDIVGYLLKVKNYDGYSNLINFNADGVLAAEGVQLVEIRDNKDTILR